MSKENLIKDAAIKKLKAMAETIDFAMMATNLKKTPIHMVPMSTKTVDDYGVIWFLSNKNSTHNEHLLKDPKLHLVYANKTDMQFLNVYGTATITMDKRVIDKLYESSDDMWFEGKDDPNVTAIAVTPSEAFFWDPKNNNLVTLIKLGVSALTGDEPDVMEQGNLKF